MVKHTKNAKMFTIKIFLRYVEPFFNVMYGYFHTAFLSDLLISYDFMFLLCKMVKHTLKILQCLHSEYFKSMFKGGLIR